MYNFSDEFVPRHPRPPAEYRCELTKQNLLAVFSDCADLQTREIAPGLSAESSVFVCWLDGLVSGADIAEGILRPLTEAARAPDPGDRQKFLDRLAAGAVYSSTVKTVRSTDELVSLVTHGYCAVVPEGTGAALCFEVKSRNTRAVSEPSLEKSLKGAKDSFVESLRVNTALVRRRICTPALKLRERSVGRKSHTKLALFYLDGVADPALVAEAERRLAALDLDALVSTGALEEYIVDRPLSPFPQLLHTERPDRFAMYLLDGRVGLLADGIPVGLVLPVTFAEFMKVTGDRSTHFSYATALLCLRWLALIISLLLPALYVAIAMYHPEMIPTRLLLSVIAAKQDVPFTTAAEVIRMLIAFSLLQEAGLRLPDPVGDTVSIIGALIVGQSAVEAKLVSPIAIIVVALSGIGCYTLPSQDLGAAVRLWRFALLLAAAAAGLFGVGAVCCLLLLHLASLDSFGTDYTAPLTDGRPLGLLRLLLLPPKPEEKLRDPELKTPDRRRQA